MKKTIKNTLFSILFLILSSFIFAESYELNLTLEEKQYLENKPYLTVLSLENYQPFDFVKNDELMGYSVDYMRLMEKILHKDLKFIRKPWSEQLEMFKNGELDIIPHIARNEVRNKFVDYTDFTHLIYLTAFIVQKNNDIDKMADFYHKKLAVVNKTYLHDYLKSNFPDIELLVLKTTEDVTEAVAQGQAFAGIGSLPTFNYFIQEKWLGNLKVATVSDFGMSLKTEMPMGVRKGNVLLKSIIEKANRAIPEEEIRKLKQKWLDINTSNLENKELNYKELEFIKKHPVIRFRISQNTPPFELKQKGKPSGFVVDYLTIIAEKIGFKAEFVFDDSSLKDILDTVEKTRDKYDTLAFLVKNEEWEKRFVFGDSYFSSPMMIIGNKKSVYIGKIADLTGKKVVVEEGNSTCEWMKGNHPGIEIVKVNNTQKALQLVNDEKVDAYIGSLAVANYMMTHGGMNNLKVQAPSDCGSIEYSFIAPKEWPELASVLSKGYKMLTPNEHSLIQQKWFSLQVVEKFDYTLFKKIIIVGFIFILMMGYWNKKLRSERDKTHKALQELSKVQEELKKNYKQLEKVSVRDKLTSLFNRQKLDVELYFELERAQRYHHIFGIVLLDIDFFKQVNDNFGHQKGDGVLIEFSQILYNNFREVDIVGRWGGEEFLVICPETNKEEIVYVSEKLRKIIAEYEFEEVGYMTASFGCTVYNEDLNVDDIIKRADDALYESKRNGRNRVSFR